MKIIYCINGWRYGRSYFMSFGWTAEQIEEMENGKAIERNGNEFSIDRRSEE